MLKIKKMKLSLAALLLLTGSAAQASIGIKGEVNGKEGVVQVEFKDLRNEFVTVNDFVITGALFKLVNAYCTHNVDHTSFETAISQLTDKSGQGGNKDVETLIATHTGLLNQELLRRVKSVAPLLQHMDVIAALLRVGDDLQDLPSNEKIEFLKGLRPKLHNLLSLYDDVCVDASSGSGPVGIENVIGIPMDELYSMYSVSSMFDEFNKFPLRTIYNVHDDLRLVMIVLDYCYVLHGKSMVLKKDNELLIEVGKLAQDNCELFKLATAVNNVMALLNEVQVCEMSSCDAIKHYGEELKTFYPILLKAIKDMYAVNFRYAKIGVYVLTEDGNIRSDLAVHCLPTDPNVFFNKDLCDKAQEKLREDNSTLFILDDFGMVCKVTKKGSAGKKNL
jgi:hypothetical protein